MNVIGLGSQPSRGLKKGVVVNIETTMASIQRVLEEAELMADCQIKEVYTGIAGSHIRCYTSHGMVAIKEKESRRRTSIASSRRPRRSRFRTTSRSSTSCRSRSRSTARTTCASRSA
jgi:cell division ATPase FtsA